MSWILFCETSNTVSWWISGVFVPIGIGISSCLSTLFLALRSERFKRQLRPDAMAMQLWEKRISAYCELAKRASKINAFAGRSKFISRYNENFDAFCEAYL